MPRLQLLLFIVYILHDTVATSLLLNCDRIWVIGSLEPPRNHVQPQKFRKWTGDLCGEEPALPSYYICDNCNETCLWNISSSHLIVSKKPAAEGTKSLWYRYESDVTGITTDCILTEDPLRSFSKRSVLIVSISFIILMILSLVWLVHYYVQRFRYAHAQHNMRRRMWHTSQNTEKIMPNLYKY